MWFSAVVLTDVVRVSELAMCTLRLSIWVFTPLPDGSEKTQNPGFDILNLGSRKFFYITVGSFGSGGGGGKGFYIRLWCGGRGMRSDRHSFLSDGCDALWRSGPGLYTWLVWKLWWSPVASPTFPSPPPKTPFTDRQTGLSELILYIYIDTHTHIWILCENPTPKFKWLAEHICKIMK